MHRLLEPPLEVGDLAGGGVDVDVQALVGGDLGSFARLVRGRGRCCFGHGSFPPARGFLGVACVNLVPVPSPDPSRPPLDRAALDPAAPGAWPGARRWRVEVLEESPSTNAAVAVRA